MGFTFRRWRIGANLRRWFASKPTNQPLTHFKLSQWFILMLKLLFGAVIVYRPYLLYHQGWWNVSKKPVSTRYKHTKAGSTSHVLCSWFLHFFSVRVLVTVRMGTMFGSQMMKWMKKFKQHLNSFCRWGRISQKTQIPVISAMGDSVHKVWCWHKLTSTWSFNELICLTYQCSVSYGHCYKCVWKWYQELVAVLLQM